MFTILVVEDDKNAAKLMNIVLTNAGYKVMLAANGKEALEPLTMTTLTLFFLI